MRREIQSWTFWVALLLLFVGTWAVYEGRHDKLSTWAPNIATAAIGFALTITVVDALLHRQARRRNAPRVENAIYWMGLSFRGFVSALTHDYAMSHAATFREIPDDARQLLRIWLEDQDREDARPPELAEGKGPMLARSGQELAKDLEASRDRDLDILEPDLVRAIDDFQGSVGGAVQLCNMSKGGLLPEQAKTESIVLESVARGAADFADVFAKYGGSWMTVLPIMKRAAEEVSARQRRPSS